MTADERQKLYDAIGYEENITSDLPKEVCYLLYFEIKTMYITAGYQYIMVFLRDHLLSMNIRMLLLVIEKSEVLEMACMFFST